MYHAFENNAQCSDTGNFYCILRATGSCIIHDGATDPRDRTSKSAGFKCLGNYHAVVKRIYATSAYRYSYSLPVGMDTHGTMVAVLSVQNDDQYMAFCNFGNSRVGNSIYVRFISGDAGCDDQTFGIFKT